MGIFGIFYKGLHHYFFFDKNCQKLNYSVLEGNRFEFWLGIQRGVTLLVWTICSVVSDKILILFVSSDKILIIWWKTRILS